MLPMTDIQQAWVLGILYGRGIAGHDAETSLRGARIRAASTTFDEWLYEIASLENAEDITTRYGHDACRVIFCMRAAQIQSTPISA